MKTLNTNSVKFTLVGLMFLMIGCKTKPPRAKFVFEKQTGGIVHFTNTSAGEITNLFWNYGDNSSLEYETNTTHRFLAGGTYNVSLTVDNEGGSSVFTETIVIDDSDKEQIEDYPVFKDVDAYFYARNIFEYDIITPDVITGIQASALAIAYDSTNFLVSIGKVNVNGQELNRNSDNSYGYHSKDSTWYFNEGLRWSASGGSGYPVIVEALNTIDFPEISAIVSNRSLTKGIDTSYVLRVKKPILLADSVLYLIEDIETGEIIGKKSSVGGFNGITFNRAELLLFPKGEYVTKVIAYSFERIVYDEKPVYFTKESYTESVLTVN